MTPNKKKDFTVHKMQILIEIGIETFSQGQFGKTL
jgi:hypothetical protein